MKSQIGQAYPAGLFSLGMLELPTLYLQDYTTPDKKAQMLEVLDFAMRTYGFFNLKDDSLDAKLSASLFLIANEYFNLSLEQKQTYSNADTYIPTQGVRGYIGSRTQKAEEGPSTAQPLRQITHNHPGEVFVLRAEKDAKFLEKFPPAYQNLFGHNIWPDIPNFREVYRTYISYAEGLGKSLCRIFAEALVIAPDFFLRNTDHSPDHVRVNHYTYKNAPGIQDSIHLGAHTDFGLFAMLLTDGRPGLEIQVGNDWCSVKNEPGTFIVNGGDILSIITNNFWHAAYHRVRQPSALLSEKRTTIVYFVNGNHDWRLSCLPDFCSDSNGWKYRDCTVGEHLWNKSNQLLHVQGKTSLYD